MKIITIPKPTSNLLHLLPPNSQPTQPTQHTQHTQRTQHTQENLVILQNGQGMFSLEATRQYLVNLDLNIYIYPKLIGLNSSSKNMLDFHSKPYLVDKYSCTYLIKNNLMVCSQFSNSQGLQTIQKVSRTVEYIAYSFIKQTKKVFLIDGHKFGGEFLAYEQDPQSNHATYLIFVRDSSNTNDPSAEHVSRLAGICKKQAIIITITMKQGSEPEIKQQSVIPRMHEPKKVISNSSNNTQQMLKLKRMLGFDV